MEDYEDNEINKIYEVSLKDLTKFKDTFCNKTHKDVISIEEFLTEFKINTSKSDADKYLMSIDNFKAFTTIYCKKKDFEVNNKNLNLFFTQKYKNKIKMKNSIENNPKKNDVNSKIYTNSLQTGEDNIQSADFLQTINNDKFNLNTEYNGVEKIDSEKIIDTKIKNNHTMNERIDLGSAEKNNGSDITNPNVDSDEIDVLNKQINNLTLENIDLKKKNNSLLQQKGDNHDTSNQYDDNSFYEESFTSDNDEYKSHDDRSLISHDIDVTYDDNMEVSDYLNDNLNDNLLKKGVLNIMELLKKENYNLDDYDYIKRELIQSYTIFFKDNNNIDKFLAYLTFYVIINQYYKETFEDCNELADKILTVLNQKGGGVNPHLTDFLKHFLK